MNVISYCLFFPEGKITSSTLEYARGLVKNLTIASDIFPGWTVHLHIDDTVPEYFLNYLQRISKVSKTPLSIFKYTNAMPTSLNMTAYRFLSASMKGVEVVLCRDTDNILTTNDYNFVQDWLRNTDKEIMVYQDDEYSSGILSPDRSPKHKYLAGGIGMRGSVLDLDWKNIVQDWAKNKKLVHYGGDQDLLNYIFIDYQPHIIPIYFYFTKNRQGKFPYQKILSALRSLPKLSNFKKACGEPKPNQKR